MKKLILFLVLASILTACAAPFSTSKTESSEMTAAATVQSLLPITEPTTEPTAPSVSLVIPGVSVEDVIRYFNEVCLDAEMFNTGSPDLLQKWASPIMYAIDGTPTPEDLETLSAFADWLNAVEGFPGLVESTVPQLTDLQIHFCSEQELLNIMGPNYTNTDGAVTFWYNGDNIIYEAVICIRTDLDQETRNSVILEELYNGLGPAQDTQLREDSLIFQGYSTPQQLTPIDELILQLLYHPDMKPGMSAPECEPVIRRLYGSD